MGRKGTRSVVEPGISQDDTGYSVRVKVRSRAREKRYPPNAPLDYLRAQRAQMEADLREELHELGDEPPTRGTIEADAETYLKRMAGHLDPATLKSRASELSAWVASIGPSRPRYNVRRSDIERIIAKWRPHISPKTVLNRVRSLKHLYRVLDGPNAKTPADGVSLPKIPKTLPRGVDRATIRTVIARLIRQERKGRLRDAKTRARFLVLVTTGQRPSQIRRTAKEDVDLAQRIWWVPAGKGGNVIPLPLNDDMLRAWTLFIAAKAWGEFDVRSFTRTVREAGWPKGVRVYEARHSVGIALSKGGTDLGDIQAFMGHRFLQTTRDFYVPGLASRLEQASQTLDNRVGMTKQGARFAGTLKYARIHRQTRKKERKARGS